MKQYAFEILFSLGLIVFIVGLFGGFYLFHKEVCFAKWENSGFKVDYGPIKGCMIQLDNDTWIPAENFRFN